MHFYGRGNDSNNLVIPVGSDYANYAAIRQNLALPSSSVLPINPLNSDGREYALHPSCPELATLFAEQKMAMLFNTGPLVQPINRTQYQKNSVAKPPQLFRTAIRLRTGRLHYPINHHARVGAAGLPICFTLANMNYSMVCPQ